MANKTYLLIFLMLAFVRNAPQAIGQTIAVSKNLCQSSFPSDARIAWICVQAKSEEAFAASLAPRLIDVLRFNRIDRMHALRGAYLKIPVKLDDIAGFTPMPQKLDQAKEYPRYILIDRAEEFLGAYEFGELRFSLPVATGRHNSTPTGFFKVLGRDRWHRSSVYTITNTDIPYPMWWGIKFAIAKSGRGLWIHSRDMPGYPASHGCVGLSDEEMQRKFYQYPPDPQLVDSKRLYLWVFPDAERDDKPYEYPRGLDGILIEIR
jgi:hypothetical protein